MLRIISHSSETEHGAFGFVATQVPESVAIGFSFWCLLGLIPSPPAGSPDWLRTYLRLGKNHIFPKLSLYFRQNRWFGVRFCPLLQKVSKKLLKPMLFATLAPRLGQTLSKRLLQHVSAKTYIWFVIWLF